jgi:hypothetical protein
MHVLYYLLLVVAYIFLGIYAVITMRRLSRLYPYGITSNKWWWMKYTPLWGMTLLLFAFDRPFYFYIPGFSLLILSGFWPVKRD